VPLKKTQITRAGHISLPAEFRRRWGTQRVSLEDLGDRIVIRPLPDDPVTAARGSLRGRLSKTGALRRHARHDDQAAARRR
jgi:bifunctional DNA-binding transcriptional regulator/antitoxin component of YhaV-PrlF toxin-antitoxin module